MKLPRFQFSLRTLFVLVTLLAIPCAYVGWQAAIVRQRRAERAWLESSGVNLYKVVFELPDFSMAPPSQIAQEPGWLRRLLGDESVFTIIVPEKQFMERARKAFPEAKVFCRNPGPATLP